MSLGPIYLIPGGRPRDVKQMEQDFRTVLDASEKLNPKIAYVGTANGDNKVFFQFMKSPMLKAGAGKVTLVPIASKGADTQMAKQILSEADIVFLSGGEVEDGILPLRKTGLDVFLAELHNSGKPFFGVSAGCIMMGRNWVHWDVEDDDSTASLFECLNFVPMTFDTHCEDEGWKELKCALSLMGAGAKGYGLSTGGFYSAGSDGRLTSYRNDPAVFRNRDGIIETEAWHEKI
ncbi:MAG: Type 1 glutamine amidotransferase-like domain-containing protein [Eubacteriaceae bacterium]|nr:Type 1 glutamine amidotransferase-like domain-containing protein [Eubacteriaceae bacterium]